MRFHRGRLLDHVHLRVADLEKSKRFYTALFSALGLELESQSPKHFAIDELWVSPRDEAGSEMHYVSRVHLAFQAESQEQVRRAYAAMLEAGGRDFGKPGERTYHPGYYAAFALDPDGNNIEAVYHGPAERSAASVEITPAIPPPKI